MLACHVKEQIVFPTQASLIDIIVLDQRLNARGALVCVALLDAFDFRKPLSFREPKNSRTAFTISGATRPSVPMYLGRFFKRPE